MAARVTLEDKYTLKRGRVVISGIQALVRLVLEQRRIDAARELNTAAFISGYQGSPLGGLDLELHLAKRLLDPAGVVFRPGLNEELAATAVAGTQLLGATPGRRHDGVTGFWYGKNPGLDRAADAIRHGNVAGTSALGGAVALIGDDPGCKSSTVPSRCEAICASLAMPLLAPSSVAEIVTLGLHAVALSRASGLWAGLKIVADIADASATVDIDELRAGIPALDVAPRPVRPALVGPVALDAEHDMHTRRLDAARGYATAHGLNRVTFDSRRARLGILASGTSYAIVLRSLADLGLDEAALDDLGIRLIKIAMPFPVDPGAFAAMADGLDEVLVVEDKTPVLERELEHALYRGERRPRVLGRFDETGRPLLSARGTLDAEAVAAAIAARVGPENLPRAAAVRLRELTAPVARPRTTLPQLASRAPYFCSGCPHNTSTRTDDDTLVGVGIGCHAMIALDGHGRGRQLGLTQMGGEGAQWIGLAPFTDDPHFVQNLGDGTFHHSGSLAVRAAVAAGVTMTYKLLYNDAVAMTGGQRAEGRLGVAEITRLLALEGVRRIIVTTPEPERYKRIALDPIASVRHRDAFADAERELAAVAGVTVLVHDDQCAAEQRRMRKRGTLPTPAEKVVINERVCEGCGDCGDKSSCLSVQPVATEFGRKTRIHQASCNLDVSCTKGDCPAFLLVRPGERPRRAAPDLPIVLPEPERPREPVLLRMPGIGGTGVVTASQILQMAAHLDGLHAAGLEQTGLAQKGGPVVSDVRIGKEPITGSVRASRRSVDVLVGFDVLGAAAEDNLATADPARTVAIVNSAITPTAEMVTNRVVVPGSPDDALERVAAVSREIVPLDANGLAERLFGDHMPANMLLLGAAYQRGCLPMSAAAISDAIRLNGAAVENTLAAFAWGRAVVADSEAVRTALAAPAVPVVAVNETARALAAAVPAGTDLQEAIALRAADLAGYQDERYARRYADAVRAFAAEAARRVADADEVARAYADNLHKLMAYKDEYEVARLHLDPVEQARVAAEFGAGATTTVLLHPPVLRALGMQRKLRFGRTATPVFQALRRARRLRGTRLDPFGYAHMRREERALVGEYRALADRALTRLTDDTRADVIALLRGPEQIRGYEQLKLTRIAQFRADAQAGLRALGC